MKDFTIPVGTIHADNENLNGDLTPELICEHIKHEVGIDVEIKLSGLTFPIKTLGMYSFSMELCGDAELVVDHCKLWVIRDDSNDEDPGEDMEDREEITPADVESKIRQTEFTIQMLTEKEDYYVRNNLSTDYMVNLQLLTNQLMLLKLEKDRLL